MQLRSGKHNEKKHCHKKVVLPTTANCYLECQKHYHVQMVPSIHDALINISYSLSAEQRQCRMRESKEDIQIEKKVCGHKVVNTTMFSRALELRIGRMLSGRNEDLYFYKEITLMDCPKNDRAVYN